MKDPSRVVVTGAAGFIGSHLVEACLARGWVVLGIDAFTDYYSRAQKEANLAHVSRHRNFELRELDLADACLEGLFTPGDLVFHLAAQAGVRSSWGDSFDVYTRSNVTAMQRLLEAAKQADVARVVFASSSSVYGEAASFPTGEDCVLRPVSPYGATKVLGENLASIYHRSLSLPIVVLRYFTVFGPRQRPDMAFSRMISAASSGGEIVVFGDGEQTRDFTYVRDAVEGTLRAGIRGRLGQAYNIGGGNRSSVNDVLTIISELVGRDLNLSYRGAQHGDARNTSGDTTKAADELGFRPVASLREGLRAQVVWHAEAQGVSELVEY